MASYYDSLWKFSGSGPWSGGNPVQGPGLGWHGDKYISPTNGQVKGASTGPAPTQQPTGNQPGDSGGGTPGLPSEADLAAQREELARQTQAAYDPIFQELNRQLTTLSSQRESGDQLVEQEWDVRRSGLETTKASQERALGFAEVSEKENTAQTLRDLAETGSNWLRAAENKWGSSSAVPAVTAALGKQLAKSRTSILSQRNSALKEIALKRVDLEDVFGQNMKELDLWKSQELARVKENFEANYNKISSAKSTMQSNMKMDLLKQAQDELARLDKIVTDFQYNLAYWRTQKQDELDFLREEMEIKSAYKSPEKKNLRIVDISGRSFIFDPATGSLTPAKISSSETSNQNTYFGGGSTSGSGASGTWEDANADELWYEENFS